MVYQLKIIYYAFIEYLHKALAFSVGVDQQKSVLKEERTKKSKHKEKKTKKDKKEKKSKHKHKKHKYHD